MVIGNMIQGNVILSLLIGIKAKLDDKPREDIVAEVQQLMELMKKDFKSSTSTRF